MKLDKTVILFIAALAIASTGCQSMQSGKKQSMISGMVYDLDIKPVTEAIVVLNGKIIATTDINGHFSISGLTQNALYSIAFNKQKYEPVEMTFTYTDPAQVIYVNMSPGSQLIAMAEKSLKASEWQKTAKYLDRAEKSECDQVESAYLRASLQYRQKEYGKAYEIIVKLIESGEDDPNILLFAADICQYKMNDVANARLYLKKFLSITYEPDVESRLEALANQE